MSDDDVVFATASELGRLLRARAVSSLDLTRAFLERLADIGPRHHALSELTADTALVQARRADRERRRGVAGSLLHGVPYGAKDVLATAGIPTRWGTAAYRDQIFDYDATAIHRLASARAVLVGKLAMQALAGGGNYRFTSASLHGAGINPWDPTRWSGSSSSGSAIAVSAGLVGFALGSDTFGSIVVPAAYCGVTALRPSWGRVSRHGVMELAWSMDQVGPMARSAEDCGWILQAIAGPDAIDPSVVDGFAFRRRGLRRPLRLGVLPFERDGDGVTIARAVADALRVLRAAGHRVTRVGWPAGWSEDAQAILAGEAAAAHRDLLASARLRLIEDDVQRQRLASYATTPAVAYVDATRRRAIARRALLTLFEVHDVLIGPTVVTEALPLATDFSANRARVAGTRAVGALTGVPVLTMPIGFGPNGLPLGLSLIGKPFDENAIIALGMQFQRDTTWHRRRPPIGQHVTLPRHEGGPRQSPRDIRRRDR